METKNGIIYCRVSSLEQVDGTSLESQERVCREYAEREGIAVSEVFIEKGESAKTADRTEFMKAIYFCSQKKNKVSTFIVYKLDRFARNQSDHVTVRATLQKYGTELRSVTEPINETPTGKLMEGVLSAFAEFDNSIRTERSVNGMRERAKQGIWVWRAPIGYCRSDKGSNIIPDLAVAHFIQLAFDEYATGKHGYTSLAALLNKRGFTTRAGRPAIPQLMEKILKNPLYCGIIKIWDMEYQGKFEPLISEELFYRCQGKKVDSRKVSHSVKNPHFPLRKLAVCEHCTRPFTGSHATGRHGKKYPYYHHQKQACEHAKFIPKESFEQTFVEYLSSITPNAEYEKLFKAIVLDIWQNNFKNFDIENAKLRKGIESLEKERQEIFTFHRSHIYSDQEFAEQKAIVMKKIAEKKALIVEVSKHEFDMDEALEYCFSYIRNTTETWLKFESKPEKRLRFQKLIFEKTIPFSGNKFGTAQLSLIYDLYQSYRVDPSGLVMLTGKNLNRLVANLMEWKQLGSED